MKKTKEKEIIDIFHQINVLLNQNITIDRTILYLSKKYPKNNIIDQINKNIQNGNSLSLALKNISQKIVLIDDFLISLITVGENSADLKNSFNIINNYLQESQKIKQEIKNSLIYPIIILITIIIFIIFVFSYLIPNFEAFYINTNQKFQKSTEFIFAFRNKIANNLNFITVITITISYLIYNFKNILKKNIPNSTKRILQIIKYKIYLKAPFFKKIYKLIISYKFLMILKISIKEKIPLNQKLYYKSKNVIINKQIESFYNNIHKGHSINSSIYLCKFIPKEIRDLISIENNNQYLHEHFNSVLNILKENISIKLNLLKKIIEPTLTVFLSCIIFLVIYFIYLPIISIENI